MDVKLNSKKEESLGMGCAHGSLSKALGKHAADTIVMRLLNEHPVSG
jgi:hypothetical protein